MKLIAKIRELINPPYDTRYLLPLFGTVLILLSIAVTVYAIRNRNVYKAKAGTWPGVVVGSFYLDNDFDNYRDSTEAYVYSGGSSACSGSVSVAGVYVNIYRYSDGVKVGTAYTNRCDSSRAYYGISLPSDTKFKICARFPTGWYTSRQNCPIVTVGSLQKVNVWFGINPGTIISGRIFKDDNANQVWDKTTEKLISSTTTCAGYYLYPVYVKVTQYSPTRVTTYTPVKCDSAGPYYKTSRLEPTRIPSGSPTIVYVVPPTGWVATTPDYGKTLKPNSTVSVWHGVRR